MYITLFHQAPIFRLTKATFPAVSKQYKDTPRTNCTLTHVYTIFQILFLYIYIHIYINHFGVYLKYCKSTIVQFLKKVLKKWRSRIEFKNRKGRASKYSISFHLFFFLVHILSRKLSLREKHLVSLKLYQILYY